MSKNKYLPDAEDIPSDFNLGNSRAKSMLANIEKSRNETFDVADVEDDDTSTEVSVVSKKSETLELDDDFEIARRNISELLEVSGQAIKDYFKMATTSESPKAMEVLAMMIKDSVDMNKSFIDIHQQKERINKTKIDNGTPISRETVGNTQNNITSQTNIMCSPGDLVKLLQDAKNTVDGDIVDVEIEVENK